jgi:tRNA G18 (ribose-2'-O)-methylase SpoU
MTSDPDLARTRGLFVAEGRLVVRRLVEGRRFRIQSLLLKEAAAVELEPVLRALDPGVPVYVGPVGQFRDVTGFNIHRGCLALAERPEPLRLDAALEGARLVLVLEGVANPDNVGGAFRNAAAFGADAVVLSSTCSDPLYRKAIRTSMGAVLQMPFVVVGDLPAALTKMANGFTLVALTPNPSADSLDEATLQTIERMAVLAGNEGDGLSPAALRSAHRRIRIPIRPEVDSLNLAVAIGIVLSRLTQFQRH